MALNFKTKLKRQNNDYNMGFIGCLRRIGISNKNVVEFIHKKEV